MDESHETAIMAIMEYVDECYSMPISLWPRADFDQQSYSTWAADELITLINDDPFTPPDIIIEGFMLKLISFYTIASLKGNKRAELAFAIAEEAVEKMLDFVLVYKSYI